MRLLGVIVMKYKPGEIVYIKATVTPQPIEGNMIRCVTADSGDVIYCTPEDLMKAGDLDVHEG